MANTPEHGLNVPLDDDEQRRLAAEAERAGLTPQQYAHDTLMQAVNDRLILETVRATVARCAPVFAAAEPSRAEREARRAADDAAAEQLGDRPLGSRNFPLLHRGEPAA